MLIKIDQISVATNEVIQQKSKKDGFSGLLDCSSSKLQETLKLSPSVTPPKYRDPDDIVQICAHPKIGKEQDHPSFINWWSQKIPTSDSASVISPRIFAMGNMAWGW